MSKKLMNVSLVMIMLVVLVPTALAAPPAQEGGQDYVVVADDWLSKLADKYLGNSFAYPAIVEYTNQKHAEDDSYAEITDPDLIEIGWKVYIPSAEEAAEILAEVPAPTEVKEELAEEQILRFGTTEEDAPDGFDPVKSIVEPSMDIQKVIYNALVRLEPGAESYADLGPDLATRWETSEDGLTWTFYLREGVQFHKGFGELTAEDVAFSLNRVRAEGSSWASVYENVKDVETVDKYTVKITAIEPDPFFLYKFSNGGGVSSVIVSKKAVEQYGDDFALNPIGTGPFQFEEYVPKQKVVLVPNKNYFRGKPILERVEYIFAPDLQARTLAMKAGELEVVKGTMDIEWVRDMQAAGFEIMEGVPWSVPLSLNLTWKPFDDIRVRQAMIYGIDRTAFADYYGPEFVKTDPVAYSPLPYNLPEYKAAKDVVKKYEYDPEKAKQLLAEAGYPDGFSVDLTWTSSARFRVPLEIVQAQVKKVGITINLNIVDSAVYYELINGPQGPGQAMALIGARRETADQVVFQWLHSDAIPGHPKAKYNYAHYGEAIPGVDDLIEQAMVELDPDRRTALYVEIQKRVAEDLPVIPLFTGPFFPYMRAPYVDMGYEWHPVDRRYPHITEETRILKH
jgi:peptide/nickel transport system substrate-binding protein